MIKILNFNRKVRSEQVGNAAGTDSQARLQITDANCNVVIATDGYYNKAHFTLTEEEGDMLEQFAQKVEARLAQDIGDPHVGLTALEPLTQPEDKVKGATA